jgi:predicted transcriptional regulator
MGHTLSVNVSDDLYDTLRSLARQKGTTPEEVAAEIVAESAMPPDKDPLLQLAGVLDSGVEDIADHHDLYIGRALAQRMAPGDET